MKNIKKTIIIAMLPLVAFGTYSFADGFFEVSKNLDIFATLYRELNMYYVDETEPGKLMKTGIDAMLKSLDPYTNYIPESDIEDYRFMTTGQYGGIGSLISRKDSFVVVSEPYEGFPAHKAGLMAGDIILEVNGNKTINKKTEEMSQILKGEPGTSLTMKVKRPTGKIEDVELVREEIKIKDVPYYGMLNDSVGYIKLTSFTQTASKDVKNAFVELKDSSEMKAAILDLRGNGGGLLKEAINIVNIFVDRGQEVVSTKGKVKDWDKTYNTLNAPTDLEMPLVVLIDGGSASASEIVSGTLQDLDRAVVIGENSFGKGLVQQTKPLSYNAQLKLTVAKYYTPSGRCIQRLDYANKDESGKATEVADSLIAEFKTNNGRSVFDGAGIEPDIKVEGEEGAPILGSLYGKQLFFDFATEYRLKQEAILPAKEFHLTQEQYEEFVKYTEGKEYKYETRTERVLKNLIEAAEDEEYSGEISDNLKALEQELTEEKSEDIYKHKALIQEVLENEIVSRYYYQTGRIEASLANDKAIAKAKEILASTAKQDSILARKPTN